VFVVYCDTNVYLDYFLNRKHANHSFSVFSESLSCKFKIAISDWVLYELKSYLNPEATTILFGELKKKNKFVIVQKTDADIEQAKTFSKHFQDPLHAILAKKAGADVLVTRNIQDFVCVSHLIDIKFPENI
jgi:predicted nucleic acid-binding protein